MTLISNGRASVTRPSLPVIVFFISMALTLILSKVSYDSEKQSRIQQSVFDAKEISKNFELLLLNDTLRLQIHLENFDVGRRGVSGPNVGVLRHLLRSTLFHSATVVVEKNYGPGKAPDLVKKRTYVVDRDDTAPSTIEISPHMKKKILAMKRKNLRTTYSLNSNGENQTLNLIWRSQTRGNEYTILSTPLDPLLQIGKARTNLSVILSDPEINLAMMAFWQGRGTVKVTASEDAIQRARSDLFFLNQSSLISVNSSIRLDWYMPRTQILSLATLTTFFSGFIISALFSVLLHFILAQNRRISELVVSRTIDLERAVSDAQEANLAKTRFLANMSHELRTPLNIILGMTELIENKVTDSKTLEFVSTMRSAGDHLLSLITDILSMSKEESVDINIKNSPITTLVFLEEIGRLIGPECRRNNLAFGLDIARDIPSVIIGDPARVRQVLTNLLKNAIKYTPEGFVNLRVTRRESQRSDIANLRFEVSDSGIGIPRDKKMQIFNRFVQLEGAKLLADGGVGLGLSIVRDLVQKMNGSIEVESEIHQGSTFIVDLAFEMKESKSWSEDYSFSGLQGRKLLIVDSDLDRNFKKRVLRVLAQPGIQIESCSLGKMNEIIAADGAQQFFKIIVSSEANLNFGFLDEKLSKLQQKFIFIGSEEKSKKFDQLTQFGKVVDDHPLLPSRLLAALEVVHPRKKIKPKSLEARADTSSSENIEKASVETPEKDLSILVADDDLTNQDLVRAYFDGKPWKTTFANNGLEAFEAFRKAQPDVIIADFRMPVLDGFEMAKSIREFEESHKMPSTPIVIVTADALEETEKRASEIPNTVFLTKPVRRSRLIEAIHSVSK